MSRQVVPPTGEITPEAECARPLAGDPVERLNSLDDICEECGAPLRDHMIGGPAPYHPNPIKETDLARRIRRLRAAVNGDDFEFEVCGGSPFDDAKALIVEYDRLRAKLAAAEALLRQHHKWHLDAGVIGLQDGEGGWIEIDNAAEYSDSLLHDNTAKALEGVPPEDAEPMPRGGISAWWWQVGVLERRKRRAAEAKLATATKALEVDPNDIWEAYMEETGTGRRSPQGAIAFAVDYLTRSLTNGAKMEQSSSQ